MLVLALESSTSSAKAMLYDAERGALRTRTTRYAPEFCRDGVSGTEEVFRQTMAAGREVAEGEQIDAIALCGIWHSIAICDSKLRPDDGTFAWNYMAPSELCRRAREDDALTGELYRRTGCMPHVTYVRQTLRYLRESGMNLANKKLMTQGGYNFLRLTGESLETRNIMSGTGLLNIHDLNYDPFALEYAGVTEAQLPPLGDFTNLGRLNAEGARLLGLREGIPVVPAHADGALNQIASGAAKPGRMTLSIGTSGAIRMTVNAPVLPKGRELWCYFGVTSPISGAAISSACNCVDWFRETFMAGRTDFAELDEGAALPEDMPTFLPFVFGERNPGWRDDRLGGFMDVRPSHTFREMYRALQAGILFNLYQCFEALVKETGRPGEIYASGGVLNSPRWTQMTADIFGQEIRCVKNRDASTIGAAALALHAAGALEDVREFSQGTEGARIVSPNPALRERYAKLYARYLELYARG